MKRNPIVPYMLIMVLGIVMIFFLAMKGVGDSKEIAKEREGGVEETEAVEFEPEAWAQQSCISCHGQNLEGGVGTIPSLHDTGLTPDEVAEILKNGRGAMPANTVPAEHIEEMAEWVANLK